MSFSDMFHRLALDDMHRWKDSAMRKPLVIRGARQVGKTVLVRMFSEGYARYAEMDLSRPEKAGIFRRGLSFPDLVQAIMLECRVPAGNTPVLIFFDEIQDCPEAVERLRFFYEDRPDLHVVAAGSLLETALASAHISFPVGRVDYLYLRPMSFVEVLGAWGEHEAQALLKEVPPPAYALDRLYRLFHRYALTGGLPEAVQRHVMSDGDMTAVGDVFSSLARAYADDIPNYAANKTQQEVIGHCMSSAPLETAARITFQGFGGSNYRSREVGEALRTIERAMLLKLLYPTTQTSLPLMPDKRKSPRLQYLDTGLANWHAGWQSELLGIKSLNETQRGRVIEQLIGQELVALNRKTDVTPVFWVRDKTQSQAEVDFVLRTAEGVVPLEAKAGKAGKLRSLHLFMERSRAPLAVRLHSGVMGMQQVKAGAVEYPMLNMPYFAVSQIYTWIQAALKNELPLIEKYHS